VQARGSLVDDDAERIESEMSRDKALVGNQLITRQQRRGSDVNLKSLTPSEINLQKNRLQMQMPKK
jgi:hypothetical protein